MSLDKLVHNIENTLAKEIDKKALRMESRQGGNSFDRPVIKEIRVVPDSPEGYNRAYLRENVVIEIYAKAPKDAAGRYLDANTGLPIQGKPDIGHKAGHEFKREAQIAYKEGLTQKEFNDKMNDSKYYQLEDLHNNRSHKYEAKF